MRWSLILSAFITVLSLQSLLSFALVTTQNEVTLDKRVWPLGKGKKKDVKASSSTYRSNSMGHPYAYDFSDPNGVRRQAVPKDQRQTFFGKLFKGKKYDADHVYEAQMYHDTLRQQGISHDQLPHSLQQDARRIMNRPENMAPIPPEVNRSKGQLVKWGLRGKPLRKSNGLSRSYSLNSYPTARETAEELQHSFQQHGYGHSGPTFHDTLHHSMMHAGVLTPGRPSPPGSPHRSQTVTYQHSGSSQPVIPQMHHSQSTRQSSSRRPSTRQSTRLQRTPSASHQQQPYVPAHHHPYQTRYAAASVSYIPQGYQNQNPYAASSQHVSQHASSSTSPYHPQSPYSSSSQGPVIPRAV